MSWEKYNLCGCINDKIILNTELNSVFTILFAKVKIQKLLLYAN